MSGDSKPGLLERFKMWVYGSEFDPPDVRGYPIEVVSNDNDFLGHLVVPTKQSGATIKQSGWRVGGDTISRTTSSGTVEEEPYEDIVVKLVIHDDHIEMGVMLETGNAKVIEVTHGADPRRTIRIPMDDITDVRRSEVKHNHMNFPGIAFETADDVYEIGIQWTANPAVKRPNKYEDDWLDDVVELMSEQIEPVSFG